MSTAFTIDATNWQEKAEELRLAYSERSVVYGGLNYHLYGSYKKFVWREIVPSGEETPAEGIWEWQNGDGTTADRLQAGANLQAASFWAQIQTFIQDYHRDVVNLDIPYDVVEGAISANHPSYGYAYPNASDSWREFCKGCGENLYASEEDYGWPRASEKDENGDLVFTRGQHQAGDFITARLIDAIVAALNHMQYRAHWVDIAPGQTMRTGVWTTHWPSYGSTQEDAINFLWAQASVDPSVTGDSYPYQGYAMREYSSQSGPPYSEYLWLYRKHGGVVLPDEQQALPFGVGWVDFYYDAGYYPPGHYFSGVIFPLSAWEIGELRGMTESVTNSVVFPDSPPLDDVDNALRYYAAAIKLEFTNGPADEP